MKKEQIPKGPHSTSTSSRKKKSKTHKSHKVKDTETPPLAGPSGTTSVPISKKEKQSLKSPTQDEQSRLEKIIEKIIEKVLNELSHTSHKAIVAKILFLSPITINSLKSHSLFRASLRVSSTIS